MIEANIVLTMKNHLVVFSFFLLLALWCEGSRAKEILNVGVILDMESPVGKIAESCIHMAISDFYAANPNYQTKIALSWRDSKAKIITAFSAGTVTNHSLTFFFFFLSFLPFVYDNFKRHFLVNKYLVKKCKEQNSSISLRSS